MMTASSAATTVSLVTNDSLFEAIQNQRAEIAQLTERIAELEPAAKGADELREQNRRQLVEQLRLNGLISQQAGEISRLNGQHETDAKSIDELSDLRLFAAKVFTETRDYLVELQSTLLIVGLRYNSLSDCIDRLTAIVEPDDDLGAESQEGTNG